MTILKERDIVLTSYERRSLFRFLALYLVSVFVLLAIIGYLFFENNRTTMQSAMKFEMMYQGRMLSSKIMMEAMQHPDMDEIERVDYLTSLKHCRFAVGYYDKHKEPLYTEIESIPRFDSEFYVYDKNSYAVIEDVSEHFGVRYVVLKENELVSILSQMRMRIIGYLILSFLLMGVVGYFLGRLFLRPVREQIESLDRFISDTTHELNTPISAILMTVASMKEIDEKKRKRLEASAKRLSVTYASLTYRLEGKEEPVDRFDLAKVIVERVEYMDDLFALKHLYLTLDLEPTEVRMARISAQRLIDNLLSNALKYTDVEDSVTIRLRGRRLEVSDTGIGIKKEAQKDIFKRYKRLNDERGGFGVGLSIVWDICKRYHIEISLRSKEGEGSTFFLRFPPMR